MAAAAGEVLTVVRRQGEVYLGWVVIGAAMIGLTLCMPPFSQWLGFEPRLELTLMFVLAVWAVWHATVHPRIVVLTTGLLVVNWFVRHWIPWSAVKRLDVDNGLLIELDSGRTIRPASGGGSLGSAIRGHRVQRDMRRTIEQARIAAPEPDLARSSTDTDDGTATTLDIKVAPFLVVAGAFILYAWVTRS